LGLAKDKNFAGGSQILLVRNKECQWNHIYIYIYIYIYRERERERERAQESGLTERERDKKRKNICGGESFWYIEGECVALWVHLASLQKHSGKK
jgi:hypothetical protein